MFFFKLPSHAICTYLITKYAKDDTLYPKDPYIRAQVDQGLHFDSGVLFSRLRFLFVRKFINKQTILLENLANLAIFSGRIRNPLSEILKIQLQEPILYNGSPDMPEDRVEYIRKAYGLLEAVLKNHDYLVGNSLTLADISSIATISSIGGVVPIDAIK
jgi:glutathione S-transferase